MRTFSLGKILRGFDSFGHPIQVNYEGSESYQSIFGGLISVVLFGFTLIQVVLAVQEVLLMDDPTLTEYAQPLTIEDRQTYLPVDFEQYDFVFGFDNQITDMTTGEKSFTLPPEIGRWVQTSVDADGQDGDAKSLLDCREVIDEETMKTAPPSYAEVYESGFAMCMDPKISKVAKMVDGQGNGRAGTGIQLKWCFDEKQEAEEAGRTFDVACIKEEFLEEWRNRYLIISSYFMVTTSIDFSAKTGYFSKSVKELQVTYDLEFGQTKMLLKVNEVEMHDSLIDPFDATTDTKGFLTVKSITYTRSPPNLPMMYISFQIDSSVDKFQRTRYNWWTALGDIGGFHDGMKLVVGIFMGPLSASFFFQNFVGGGVYSPGLSPAQRGQRKQARVALESDQESLTGLMKETIVPQIQLLQSIKGSLLSSLTDWVCRRRKQRRQAMAKLNDKYTAELDVRRMISNSLALKDFIRGFLPKQQQVLLAHSRSRVALLDSEESDQVEPGERDFEKFDLEALKKALNDLGQSPSPFDRMLLRGILTSQASSQEKITTEPSQSQMMLTEQMSAIEMMPVVNRPIQHAKLPSLQIPTEESGDSPLPSTSNNAVQAIFPKLLFGRNHV